MEEIGAGFSLLVILGFIAFLIWHGDRSRQERRRHKLEERDRLLTQIGTGEALTNFLQTEEGRKLLAALNEPEPRRYGHGGMRMSVIGLLTAGVITLFVGAGFFYAAPRVYSELIIPGVIIGGVGVGCIVAALIQYALGKAWGMLKSDEENGSSRRRLE